MSENTLESLGSLNDLVGGKRSRPVSGTRDSVKDLTNLLESLQTSIAGLHEKINNLDRKVDNILASCVSQPLLTPSDLTRIRPTASTWRYLQDDTRRN